MRLFSRNQRGMTLIELMVALAVSSVMLLGIGNIYVSSKSSYILHDEFARLQENGRFALETLSQAIRDAGDTGCSAGDLANVTNTLKITNDLAWNLTTGLAGFEFTGTGPGNTYPGSGNLAEKPVAASSYGGWAMPAGLNINYDIAASGLATVIIPGSDILIVRTTTGSGVDVIQNNDAANVFVRLTSTVVNGCPNSPTTQEKLSGICNGDILVISDCEKSRIFQATDLQKIGACGTSPACLMILHSKAGTVPPGNSISSWKGAGSSKNINKSFTPGSEILTIKTFTFFIGRGINGPALFRMENANTPQELVEGIESMQVLYGVDSTGDKVADQYFPANTVPDIDGDPDTVFDGVVSARISLLVRTVKEMPNLKRTAAMVKNMPLFNTAAATDITIKPPIDGRLRKVYSTTVKARNRAFKTIP